MTEGFGAGFLMLFWGVVGAGSFFAMGQLLIVSWVPIRFLLSALDQALLWSKREHLTEF
jgi:hypothetical protein